MVRRNWELASRLSLSGLGLGQVIIVAGFGVVHVAAVAVVRLSPTVPSGGTSEAVTHGSIVCSMDFDIP